MTELRGKNPRPPSQNQFQFNKNSGTNFYLFMTAESRTIIKKRPALYVLPLPESLWYTYIPFIGAINSESLPSFLTCGIFSYVPLLKYLNCHKLSNCLEGESPEFRADRSARTRSAARASSNRTAGWLDYPLQQRSNSILFFKPTFWIAE